MRDITEIASPPQFGAAPVRIRPQRSFETAKAQVRLVMHALAAAQINVLLLAFTLALVDNETLAFCRLTLICTVSDATCQA